MTAILPERPTAMEAIAGAPHLIVPGIADWLGKTDFEQSIDEGSTESFEAYCDRISKKEGQ